MDQGLLFQTPLQGLDELVAVRLELVFDAEDFLALAAFQGFVLFLQGLRLFSGGHGAWCPRAGTWYPAEPGRRQ